MRRHAKAHGIAKPKLYYKHAKVEGRYKCHFCDTSYSHTRDLKKHYKKKHLAEIEDLPPEAVESLKLFRRGTKPKEEGDKVNEERKDSPVSQETLKAIQPLIPKIPFLATLNQSNALESPINLDDVPRKHRVVFTDGFVYKVWRFKQFLESQRSQWGFQSERTITTEAKANQY